MNLRLVVIAGIAFALSAQVVGVARAQDGAPAATPAPSAPIPIAPAPNVAPGEPDSSFAPPLSSPSAPTLARPLSEQYLEAPKSLLFLSAALAPNDVLPLKSALKWRIYQETGAGPPKLIVESAEATPRLILPNGTYLAHVAYGLAGATRLTRLNGSNASERLTLNAGGLKVVGLMGDALANPQKLRIAVYVPEPGNSEAKLVLAKGKASEIIILPEGLYHVVSTLYDSPGGNIQASSGEPIATNSVVTADVRVQAGKLTEASLRHRVATMTLKLVENAGGEAFANTTFTVLTPGGDVIRELVGAFPQLSLAEGEYTAIARYQGKTYQSTFKVAANHDQDVEVLAREALTETPAPQEGRAPR